MALELTTPENLVQNDSVPVSKRNRETVVAIDDDPLTLRLLTAHLSNSGYSIRTAETGTTGLELIDDDTAVAVVDLKLPDLSGFEILHYLKQHHPTVHVIVLTGSGDVSDAVEAMRAGAFQFVTKPFDPSEFWVYVEKAICSNKIAGENLESVSYTHLTLPTILLV